MGMRRGKAVEQRKHRRDTQQTVQTVSICDRKQTPTMFAGPAGVAPGVCTMLAPLDSSWVTRARSCTNRCCQP